MEIERESIIGLFEWLTEIFFVDKFIFPLDEVCRQACLVQHCGHVQERKYKKGLQERKYKKGLQIFFKHSI
jgi:hypothetical protein